jgi:cell division protein FtsN
MFVAGLVVGAVGASFFMGLRSDDPESIGRGISHMIEASKDRFRKDAPPTPEPAKAQPTTEFDFYMLLPEVEHIVPDTNVDASSSSEEQKEAVTSEDGTEPDRSAERQTAAGTSARFELQAGAFVRMSDADRLKARLALEGLESRIQKVSIEGRGDFFRVRLGPFDDMRELEAVNGKLSGMGIKALRLRIASR